MAVLILCDPGHISTRCVRKSTQYALRLPLAKHSLTNVLRCRAATHKRLKYNLELLQTTSAIRMCLPGLHRLARQAFSQSLSRSLCQPHLWHPRLPPSLQPPPTPCNRNPTPGSQTPTSLPPVSAHSRGPMTATRPPPCGSSSLGSWPLLPPWWAGTHPVLSACMILPYQPVTRGWGVPVDTRAERAPFPHTHPRGNSRHKLKRRSGQRCRPSTTRAQTRMETLCWASV